MPAPPVGCAEEREDLLDHGGRLATCGVDAHGGQPLVGGAPLVHHLGPAGPRVDHEQRPAGVEPDPAGGVGDAHVEEDDGVPGQRRLHLGVHRGAAAERRRPRPPRRARAAPRRAPARGSGPRRGRRTGRGCDCPAATSMARSVSWAGRSRARPSRRPIVLLPTPGGPMRTSRGVVGRLTTCASPRGSPRGMPRGCVPSRPPSRRRTSRRRPGPGRARPSPRRPPRRPGTAHTSERWWIALAASAPVVSTVSRARGTVEIGFIAARTRSTSPVDMPPSVPPARPVRRWITPAASRSISSCAAEPRRAAVRKPSPTSTPLIAWMPISAAASWASSRRSQWTCEPRPGGRP